jgi:thiamine biosynthesis lipoprotein
MMTPGPSPDAHLITHEAMNTTFTLHVRSLDEKTAHAMARECFDVVDWLESHLSRFIEGSDVSRINHLRAGETLYLSEPCHQCLLLAMRACTNTRGLFDITLGTRIAHQKSGHIGPEPTLTGILTLHPDVAAITCESPGREIDLGGIAKGFALDQLQPVLNAWDATDTLVAAGASSFLACGPSAWPVELTGERDRLPITLTHQALSASGTGIQGKHIVHPTGTGAMPSNPATRVWVLSESAALAEIWSTTLMLVAPQDMLDFISLNPDITAAYAEHHGHVQPVVPPIENFFQSSIINLPS